MYTVRPISDRTWLGAKGREATRFNSKWGSTLELLEREIAALRGREVYLEIDVTESDLRLDGTLRVNARPTSSAVALAFESKHGPLLYTCDRFFTNWAHQGPEWQHNVRAIALTLEALRAVDRYGASASGEQYRGYKAIGSGSATAMPAGMSREDALELLWTVSQLSRENPWPIESLHRKARARAHPDRNDGDQALWDQVEQAAAVLGVLS